MKKSVFLFTFLSFFVSSFLFSQKNLRDGYIVDISGDTLRGQILDKNREHTPGQARFQKTGESQTVVYKPSQIKAFSTGNDLFISKVVAYDVTVENALRLPEGDKPQLKTDTLFLKVLVLGKASLYSLYDDQGKQHYFIEKDTAIRELLHTRYLKVIDGVSYTVESDRYRQELFLKMSDCAAVLPQIDQLGFSRSSFVKLFNTYNACINSPSVYISRHEKISCIPGVFLGGVVTTPVFDSKVSGFLQDARFSPATSITGGASLNFIFPRNHKSWSIYLDLFYKGYKTSAETESQSSPGELLHTTYSLDYAYVKLSTMLRYQFTAKKVRPFLNIGITNGYAVKDQNTQTSDLLFQNAVIFHRSDKMFSGPRRYEQGFIGGIGAAYKQFGIEFRYERGNGMLLTQSVSAVTHSFSLIASYSFR